MRGYWIATGFIESIVENPQVAVTSAEPCLTACLPIRNAFPLQSGAPFIFNPSNCLNYAAAAAQSLCRSFYTAQGYMMYVAIPTV